MSRTDHSAPAIFWKVRGVALRPGCRMRPVKGKGSYCRAREKHRVRLLLREWWS